MQQSQICLSRPSKSHSTSFLGEPGLLVARKRGKKIAKLYKGNVKLTTKKLIHDVFKKGDHVYSSGDILCMDKEYFVYFVDRVGDTFR